MIHGGAFFIGDKGQEEFYLWCRHFASLGYVAASINYRIGFRPTYNEVQRAGYRAVQDANAAIRYLINRSAYRIDPNRVFVAGTSAGAITALNVAFMMEKNRPEITFGGRLGDEGTIDMINPGDKGPFKILAVGNMWGAIQDLDMLRNSSASVISFHSEKDPIVPYGRGYPFQEYLGAVALNTLLFDRMYGSYEIDRELNRLQRRTELTTYPGDKHSVHFDSEGNLNRHFTEIQDKLVSFFSDEMKPKPVRLLRNGSDPQLFSIDTDQVRECFWKVEGGVILSCDSSSVRILLFPDSPFHELSVSGYYKTGQTFQESFSL
jgi:dienelactone hydrolase